MSDTIRSLSPHLQASFQKLSEEQQNYFVQEFNKRKKDTALMVILAIFCPILLFLLGKTGLGIAFF